MDKKVENTWNKIFENESYNTRGRKVSKNRSESKLVRTRKDYNIIINKRFLKK